MVTRTSKNGASSPAADKKRKVAEQVVSPAGDEKQGYAEGKAFKAASVVTGSSIMPELDAEKYPHTHNNPALWQARVDLAAVYRLCHNHKLNEGIDNHLTVMAPGHTDKFLVIAYGWMWSEVTASNLLLVAMDGKVLEGEGPDGPGVPEYTAFYIHSEIHRADPVKYACVLHTHQPYASAICCLEGGKLEMIHQNCLRFYDEVAYDSTFNGLVTEGNEGKRIADFVQGKRIYMHANHGIIVGGASVAEAWEDLYYFERAAEVQVLAYSMGRELKYIGNDIADAFKKDCDQGAAIWSSRHFEAAKRDLIRQGKDADFCT